MSVSSRVLFPPLQWNTIALFYPSFSIRICYSEIISSLLSRSSFLDLTTPSNKILFGWYDKHAILKAFLTKLICPLQLKHFYYSSIDFYGFLLFSFSSLVSRLLITWLEASISLKLKSLLMVSFGDLDLASLSFTSSFETPNRATWALSNSSCRSSW